jgi:predicted enzyme related to lactoylglutathione lyase
MNAPQEGTWCHVEILVKDPEAAKRFYGEVFGWQFQDHPEMGYTTYTTREGEIGGGIMQRPAEVPQQMVNYVLVQDIPATLARITSNGGTIVQPETAVSTFGAMAWVTDPDGNLFALWRSNPEAH